MPFPYRTSYQELLSIHYLLRSPPRKKTASSRHILLVGLETFEQVLFFEPAFVVEQHPKSHCDHQAAYGGRVDGPPRTDQYYSCVQRMPDPSIDPACYKLRGRFWPWHGCEMGPKSNQSGQHHQGTRYHIAQG